jgi:hypothetical protein
MSSRLTTSAPRTVLPSERLADWSSMAGRGVTVGDLRAAVNPSLEAAGKTSCFSRRGDHRPSLRSRRNGRDVHKPVVTAVIKDSAIISADLL